MPELKSLLREFGRVASTQCFDAGSEERIQISLSQESSKYVPPQDGWIVLEANGTGVQTELFSSNLQILSVNNFGTWGRCSLPVKQGDEVTINVWGLSSAATHQAYFVPSRGFV